MSKRGYCGVALVGVKDPANFGGALRAAHVHDASYVQLVNSRMQKTKADTSKAYRNIPVMDETELHIPIMSKVVVIEVRDDAESLFTFKHPKQAIYVFGPEDGSVPEDIVKIADHVVSIPTKYCMNLAATINVVLYDRNHKEYMKCHPSI